MWKFNFDKNSKRGIGDFNLIKQEFVISNEQIRGEKLTCVNQLSSMKINDASYAW